MNIFSSLRLLCTYHYANVELLIKKKGFSNIEKDFLIIKKYLLFHEQSFNFFRPFFNISDCMRKNYYFTYPNYVLLMSVMFFKYL